MLNDYYQVENYKPKPKSNPQTIKLNMSARNISLKAPTKPFCKVCHDAGKSEKEYTSHFVKSEPGPNGKVVCPTLLAQECRYCFANGHTAGYCPAIAAKKKDEEKALKMASRKEVVDKKPLPKLVEKKSKNPFDLLGDSSDSDTDEKVSKKVTKKAAKSTTISAPIIASASASAPQKQIVIKKEDFPSLPMKTIKKVAVPVMSGYANAAAKTQQDYETERYEQQLIENSMKKNQMPPMQKSYVANQECSAKYESDDSWEQEEVAVVRKPFVPASLLDWAAVDSDDEDW